MTIAVPKLGEVVATVSEVLQLTSTPRTTRVEELTTESETFKSSSLLLKQLECSQCPTFMEELLQPLTQRHPVGEPISNHKEE